MSYAFRYCLVLSVKYLQFCVLICLCYSQAHLEQLYLKDMRGFCCLLKIIMSESVMLTYECQLKRCYQNITCTLSFSKQLSGVAL
jgi:hypothetical protein